MQYILNINWYLQSNGAIEMILDASSCSYMFFKIKYVEISRVNRSIVFIAQSNLCTTKP